MSNAYIIHSRLSSYQFRRFLKLFCLDLTAAQIANRNTVYRLAGLIRCRIAGLLKEQAPMAGVIEVADATQESVAMMRKLFSHYIEYPETMGDKARTRIEQEGLWRTACDYVAGCTDRYAMEEFKRFGFGD